MEDRNSSEDFNTAAGRALETVALQLTPYAEADAATKAKLDALIAPLERDPGDFDAVINYGVGPVTEVSALTKDFISFLGAYQTMSEGQVSIAVKDLTIRYLTAVPELCLHISAGEELLRRYTEKINAAGDDFGFGTSALIRGKDNLLDQMVILESSRVIAARFAGDLRQLMTVPEDAPAAESQTPQVPPAAPPAPGG